MIKAPEIALGCFFDAYECSERAHPLWDSLNFKGGVLLPWHPLRTHPEFKGGVHFKIVRARCSPSGHWTSVHARMLFFMHRCFRMPCSACPNIISKSMPKLLQIGSKVEVLPDPRGRGIRDPETGLQEAEIQSRDPSNRTVTASN